MQTVSIIALDTLFFGSGRPFTMTEESWATSIFPPLPTTLHGFLRGSYFINDMSQFKKADSDKDPTKDLKITNYGLKRNGHKIYPLPLDFVVNQKYTTSSNTKLERLELGNRESNNHISNYALYTKDKPFYLLNYSGNDKVRNTNGEFYISEEDLMNYLTKENFTPRPFKLSNYVTVESKTGIKRDLKNDKNKLLYRLNLTRLENKDKNILSIYITYEGIELPKKMTNRLGGEGKLVFLKEESTKELASTTPVFSKGEVVLMYLATPAIFNNFNPAILGTSLIAASMGSISHIGGWNKINSKPKNTKKVLAAGSIFYLKIEQDNFKFPNQVGEDTLLGYGKIYIKKTNDKVI